MKLKTLLWIDFFVGFVTAVSGVLFFNFFQRVVLIQADVLITILIVTLLYSLLALLLARQKVPKVKLIKILITANWLWSLVSVALLVIYFSNASILGKIFLIAQLIVVGGLALLEGKALAKTTKKEN